MEREDAATWRLAFPEVGAPVALKPLLDDQHWAKGPNWTLQPNQSLEVYPRFFRDQGVWARQWPDFRSALLGNGRGVWMYWPPTMLENPAYRAPVVYMCDGQNLFDPAAAFAGETWRVGETLDGAAQDGSIAEAFVVGPENARAGRFSEYTPTRDASRGAGGQADLYLKMLVEELKPLVDAKYRTLTTREYTALVGSSLGGLLAAHAGATVPEVFGLVGALSPSTWWDQRVLLRTVQATPAAPKRPLRVYVDAGDVDDGLDDTRALVEAYRALGYRDGTTLSFVTQRGAGHNERWWAERLPGALRFLLGSARPGPAGAA